MALTTGTRLGPYEVTALIGVGGMGEVYQATDTKLGRQVAIKVLPSSVASDPDRLARFDREAKTLAALNHPNIAAIYGLEDAAGYKALVMELVEGETLAQRLALVDSRRKAQGSGGLTTHGSGPTAQGSGIGDRGSGLPVEEALAIAKQIAEALEAAHGQGIIHRDLKPANVKVRPDGAVKVLDFGLAKAMEQGSGIRDRGSGELTQSPTITTPAMTQMGMILGTAAYMSPEQAKGRAADKRADIWSFGCVFLEMLTGRPAFEGDDVSEVLASVIKGTTTLDRLPPDIHPALRRLLGRCLQKDIRQRFQDIGDVRYELEHFAEESRRPVAETAVAPSPVRRASWLPWAAALALATVVGLAVWALQPSPDPDPVIRFRYDLPSDQLVGDSNTVLAVAPDGSGFATVTAGGLFFRPLDSLEGRTIAADAVAPFFSHDGRWVGFFSGGNWVKAPITGGSAVTIGRGSINTLGMSWDADDRIWYAEGDGIHRVSANGGGSELVIAGEPPLRFADPQPLPGGDWVLFSVGSPGNWDAAEVVVQSLRSGERRVVWSGGHAARYVSTGHLVYAQGNTLFAIPLDLGTMTTTGGPVPIVTGVQTAANLAGVNYGITEHGTLVYLEESSTAAATRTLALVDRSGRAEFLDVPPNRYLSPRLSPDGRRLAVQVDAADGNSQIWTYDLSGDTAMQQMTLEGNNFRPLWTPDGQRIAFASDRGGQAGIYWQAADGSGLAERLTTAEQGGYHLPDAWFGTTLAFRRELSTVGSPNNTANEMDIWTVSVDGGTPGEPTPFRADPTEQEGGAAFSPDGRWLAYHSGVVVGLDFRVYVEPFPPTGERRLVSKEQGIMPLWSRNGRELFYRTVNQTGTAPQTLKKINVSTTPSFTFTSEEPVAIGRFMSFAYYRSFDVTPDGERFLVVLPPERTELDAVTPRVGIVVNWFEELKRLVPVP